MHRIGIVVLVAATAVLLIVCQVGNGSRSGTPSASAAVRAAVTASARPGATVPALAVPPVSHIFVIVMENRESDQIIGNPQAPYINALAGRYALATDYFAIRHPSLPNYLALIGGETFGVSSDCTSCIQNAPNLVDALEHAGKSWKSYQEGLPHPCFTGAGAGEYAMKHDPFMYFRDIRDNPGRCDDVVPLSQFGADLRAGAMPDFSFITPNLIHDMHNGSIAQGDRWLSGFVPTVLKSPAWRDGGVLFIVWDEGSSGAGCCGLAYGGHVPLLVITPSIEPGRRIESPVTHYSLLRAIEDVWGLPRLGHSADAAVKPILTVTSR